MSCLSSDPLVTAHPRWVLRFDPLVHGQPGYAFPCDSQGNVDMDRLGERVLQNYLFARAMMGRQTSWPKVQRAMH